MSDKDPLLELTEDEDDEKDKPSVGQMVRRVFGAGQRSEPRPDPDNFTGSFRGVPAPKRGGRAYVTPEETLGDDAHCWCGELAGHDWPGKAEGAPHPRVSEQERDQNMVNAAAALATNTARLDKRQLRKFDDRVARMVMELVNTYHVPWRMQKDGVHLLLYPLVGNRPHKVGAARGPEQTMAYLERWVAECVTPALVTEKAQALADRFNDPAKRRRTKSEQSAETPISGPEQDTVAPEAAEEPEATPEPVPAADTGHWEGAPDPAAGTPPEGYEQAYAARSNPPRAINWWKQIGADHWICKSCDYETDNLQYGAAHQRAHTQDPERLRAVARKAGDTRVRNNRKAAALDALQVLALAAGVELAADDQTVAKLDAKITELTGKLNTLTGKLNTLTAKLEKVTTERDNLKAKLEIIREGLKL